MTPPKESRVYLRGFGSMAADRQREIASKGGKAAHRKGVAHQWTSDEARAAGQKGGKITAAERQQRRQAAQQEVPPDGQ